MNLDNITGISFLALAALLLLLERIPGFRRTAAPVQYRWLTNLGLMLLGGVIVSVLFPASITAVTSSVEAGMLGSLHLPLAAEVVLVFLLLDCWHYWEHRAYHEVPLLWRAHLVHHSDTALDVTTAERHHPFEKILSTLLAFMLVFALGFSAQALGIYLLVATLSALYTHANIALPEAVDRPLRRWLVTPAVHAIHHSSYQPETDSNYGSLLTVWDRLFGTYIDPADAHIPRIGLDYFRQARDTTLAPVLLQPFEYRRGAMPPETLEVQQDDASSPQAPLSQEWSQALRYGGIGLALVLLALWPTVVDLTHVWSVSEPYQYAWLVAPMFIYLVGWHHRDSILAMQPAPGYTGLPLILLAGLMWMAASAVEIKLGEHMALVVALQGIALCSLGWPVYRRLLPVMLLLFVMVPCGDILQPLLRDLTVKWIEWFAIVAGLPHTVEGYVIYVGTNRYVVIDACSGLTFFTLAGFLGYSFGLLLFRSLPKVLALAALGAALGILTNAARVSLIVGIDWLRGSQLDLAAHGDIQWLVLLASLGLLLFLASRLAHGDSGAAPAHDRAETPEGDSRRYSPVMAGALMAGCVALVQAADYRADTTDAHAIASLRLLAEHYPGSHTSEGGREASHTLSIPFSNSMEVVLITPANGTSRLDESSLRPEDENIWRHADTGQYRDCSVDPCMTFVHTTWKRKGNHEARHVFYSYYVADMTTDSKLTYRLASGWKRLENPETTGGLIGFKLNGSLPENPSLAATFCQLQGSVRSQGAGVASSRQGYEPHNALAGNLPSLR